MKEGTRAYTNRYAIEEIVVELHGMFIFHLNSVISVLNFYQSIEMSAFASFPRIQGSYGQEKSGKNCF